MHVNLKANDHKRETINIINIVLTQWINGGVWQFWPIEVVVITHFSFPINSHIKAGSIFRHRSRLNKKNEPYK
jgi:hypothetical protein